MIQKIWNNAIDMPPVWLLTFMAGVYWQARLWNPLGFSSAPATWAGRGLIVAGVLLMLWAFLEFRRHMTTVVPKRTPRTILQSGPYRFSRNPIYLADALVLGGYALTLGSVIGLLLVPVFMWVIRTRFINGEEKHILAEFGEPYAAYCRQTRRWI